jgi:integrase
MRQSSSSRGIRKAPVARPPKPYLDFPLSPHPSGRWQKKIRGQIHYFGRWGQVVDGVMTRIEGDGWKEALDLYIEQRDDLFAGRKPRPKGDGVGPTIADLCNAFLTAKERQRDAGEITARTFVEYMAVTDRIVGAFGRTRVITDLRPDDFAALRDQMAKQWGPTRLGNFIQMIRTVFKFGYEAELIDRPVRFGPEFKKPSAGVLRRQRAKRGERMIEAADLRRLIDAAPQPLRAMLLLGVNGGFGNHDCATLPLSALDLDRGWINYPRPKTGVPRRVPLWPETVVALRDAIAVRFTPRIHDAADLVFVTVRGRPWLVRGIANPISVAARHHMKAAGVHNAGIGFYTLRHVFRTVADGAKDQVAANAIMGHADASMAGAYRERIEDDRLRAVVSHVRQWLYGNE